MTNKIRYRHLTEDQKNIICNGCGGKGGLVKPPHRTFFKKECNHHDFNYFLGHTEDHRAKADLQLLMAMKKKVQNNPITELRSELHWSVRYVAPDFVVRKIMLRWCWAYYMAVRVGGHSFFYYGDKEQNLPTM